jgi:hypothetical protein
MTTTTANSTSLAPGPEWTAGFEARVAAVAANLLRAIGSVIEGIPRVGPGPLSLARELRIDKVLASRVLKALRAEDAIGGAYHMPGPDPLRRLVRAAAKRGVSAGAIGAALRAIEEFESLIREQVGDRSLLDSILCAWVPEARREFELRRKQAAFKAISQLHGVQAGVIMATVLLSPTAGVDDRVDVVWINGLIGVHRVRPGATVRLATRRMPPAQPDATARRPTTLDGRPVESPETLLLREFCSNPMPRLHVRRAGETCHYTLADGGFGARSAADLVFVEVNRAEIDRFVPRGTNRKGYVFAEVATPAEALQFDVLVHRDLYPGQAPSLLVYDTAFEGVANVNDPARDIHRLDLAETVAALGEGADRVRSPDVPRYAEMLRHVTERAGIDGAALRGYRCRVDYPLYGTQVVMAFNAVERP